MPQDTVQIFIRKSWGINYLGPLKGSEAHYHGQKVGGIVVDTIVNLVDLRLVKKLRKRCHTFLTPCI